MGVSYIWCMNYSTTLVVKLPPQLSDALSAAAERAMMTKSEYVRQAIVEKLKQS
jgi:predicted HicB family RNase H-like nuclease